MLFTTKLPPEQFSFIVLLISPQNLNGEARVWAAWDKCQKCASCYEHWSGPAVICVCSSVIVFSNCRLHLLSPAQTQVREFWFTLSILWDFIAFLKTSIFQTMKMLQIKWRNALIKYFWPELGLDSAPAPAAPGGRGRSLVSRLPGWAAAECSKVQQSAAPS